MIYKHLNSEIELYDSIHEMPILRFQRFNKYQMMSSQVGNTFEDYDQRTIKAMQFLKKGMTEEALQELENRRITVFNAFNEYTPTGMSFALLVKRIDDVSYTKMSSDNLKKCLTHLDDIGLSDAKLIEKLTEVKKN